MLLVLSDTAISPEVFARNPEWYSFADMDGASAVTKRRRLLDMVTAERMPMCAYHFPFPSTGYIAREGNGYAFAPATWQPVL
jgi:hypothetical protein